MKAEVYGIPEEVGRCHGCIEVRRVLDELRIAYTFNKVLFSTPEGLDYDRPLIESLAKRAGFKSLSIRYPVVFIDDVRMTNLKEFKAFLIKEGFDSDIIEN